MLSLEGIENSFNVSPILNDNLLVVRGDNESYFQRMQSLLLSDLYSDIAFEIDGKIIHAHKFVLAMGSKYFFNMFQSEYYLSITSFE